MSERDLLGVWGWSSLLQGLFEHKGENVMKKVFISQPMNGLTDEQILEKRNEIIEDIKNIMGNDVEIIDSFLHEYPENVHDIYVPVWCLGKSIQFLSQADVVYFARGWRDARGCVIEHEVAVQYGIDIIVEDTYFINDINNDYKSKYPF